jgi:uncharacterized protein (TIGR00645 family)
MTRPNRLEYAVEWILFASRWLMAPFYLGLVLALLALLVIFVRELLHALPQLLEMSDASVVLWLLGLIDLSLVGNLLLTVILAGYENFVSRTEMESHPDWPAWMGKVDFSGMKLKLIASIAAISAIHLLEIFMTPEKLEPANLGWLLAIQGAILLSGIMLALMDYISEYAKKLGESH